jgi:hypothetical protein
MGAGLSSSDSHHSTNQNIQDNTRCSLELDGLLYEFRQAESMQCDVNHLITDFPRNFIYCNGNMLKVSLLSLSICAAATMKTLVLPRILHEIAGESDFFP